MLECNEKFEFFGQEYMVEVNDLIRLDNRNISERLLEGDDYVDSEYIGSQFRYPVSLAPKGSASVNVKVTGRVPIWNHSNGLYGIRVKIEWVGDGEESKYSYGFLFPSAK